MDLRRLAGEFALSWERFRKVFARETGVAPGRWRQQRRIDRAKALLAEGLLPLAAIAARLGYRDEFFFNRQFTRATGITPARFRRAITG